MRFQYLKNHNSVIRWLFDHSVSIQCFGSCHWNYRNIYPWHWPATILIIRCIHCWISYVLEEYLNILISKIQECIHSIFEIFWSLFFNWIAMLKIFFGKTCHVIWAWRDWPHDLCEITRCSDPLYYFWPWKSQLWQEILKMTVWVTHSVHPHLLLPIDLLLYTLTAAYKLRHKQRNSKFRHVLRQWI